jgi:hypothetical protein
MRPSGLSSRNHILRQKPPREQAKPSVKSAKINAPPPNNSPVPKAATKKAPWTAFVTGGCMTYTIRTVTARLTKYVADRNVCSHFVLIPTNVYKTPVSIKKAPVTERAGVIVGVIGRPLK